MIHNMSMNTQRITISIPNYLYDNLVRQLPAGKISRFVAQAIEKELARVGEEPTEEFIALRRKLPKKTREEIIRAIKKGRI
jgi:hypothetical protein